MMNGYINEEYFLIELLEVVRAPLKPGILKCKVPS